MKTAAELMAVFARHGLLSPATWRPFGGSPYPINGEYKAGGVLAFGMVETSGPVYEVAAADVPDVSHGDALTIAEGYQGAGFYKIVGVDHGTGKGFLSLKLQVQA